MPAPLIAAAAAPAASSTAGSAAGASGMMSKMPKMVSPAMEVIRLADALIPGKHEKRLRQEHEALNQQVKSGHGMSKGQRQSYLASMAQARNAQLQQLKPQINRGFAGDSGQSGIVHGANQGMMRSAMDSARGDDSQVQQLDMAMLEQKKAMRDGQRKEIMALNRGNRDDALAAGQALYSGMPSEQTGVDDRLKKGAVAEDELGGLAPIGK